MACNGRCACGGVEYNISVRPGIVNYCVTRGDGFADTVTIKEAPTEGATPEPVDLTSPARTYIAQLRKNPNSTTVVATFDIDMSDAADGEFVFSLPSSVTQTLSGEYGYDIEQYIDPSTEPRTILSGTFTFSPDYTK
jgi:hypothetical protein